MNKYLIFFLFNFLILSQIFSQPTGEESKYVRLSLKIKHKSNFLKFKPSNKSLDTIFSENDFKLNAFTNNYKNNIFSDSTIIRANKNAPYKINVSKENIVINYRGNFNWIDKYHADLIISIQKKCKKMLIKFKIYEDCSLDIEIPFKKGYYEVIDSENPELIKTTNK